MAEHGDIGSPGPPGAGPARFVDTDDSFTLEGTALAPLDRYFPTRALPFLTLVVAVSAVTWWTGYLLAPDKARFLASPEWRFMPVYLAAHFIAVRLFVTTYTRNFRAGVRRLDVTASDVTRGVRLVLGPAGLAIAAVIAAPFCTLDFQYLTSTDSRYERMGPGNTVAYVDYLMWCTWCLEWLLNALIWLMLVVFLVKNSTLIARYSFRDPIEIVVQERHYRPFLRMSSQGATILLGFGAVTIFYLYYTGGELTDYFGLAITTALLVVGFVPPWMLLRQKVSQAVESETQALRVGLSQAIWRDHKAREGGVSLTMLEKRLDEALTIFRISYLEQLKLNLGGREARAIMLRLLAPLLGAAWQLSQSFEATLGKLDGGWKALRGVLMRLMGP